MSIGNVQRIYPSVSRPGVILPVNQNADFAKYFAEITKYGKESSAALYQDVISNYTTPTSIGQQWRGSIDQVDLTNKQLAYYYYTIQAAYSFTRQQAATAADILQGISLADLLDKLSRMAINQRRHYASLFGFDPSETQGLINLATSESLPADSDSNQTITSYIVAELFAYLNEKVRDIMDVSYGTLKPAVIVSSPRIIHYLQTAIIPLTSYLDVGSGTESVAGAFSKVSGQWLGIGKIEFVSDYLLQETGTNSTDQILFIAPGLSKQEAISEEFSQYLLDDIPSNAANTFMDSAGGLIKSTNPELHRTTSYDLSYKTTAGAVTRQDAVFVVEAAYE